MANNMLYRELSEFTENLITASRVWIKAVSECQDQEMEYRGWYPFSCNKNKYSCSIDKMNNAYNNYHQLWIIANEHQREGLPKLHEGIY